MKKFILTLILIPSIALGAWAQNKKELSATIANLQEEVATLKAETSAQQKENRELQGIVLKLQNAILQYEQSQADLKEQVATLERKVEALSKGDIQGANFDPKLLEGRTPEETAINTLLHNYMKTDNPHDRFEYVIQSDKVKEAMKAYYGAKIGLGKLPMLRADDIKILSTDITSYNKAIDVIADHDLFYVVRTQDGYKVDWMGSLLVNDESMERYIKSGSRSPKTFKVSAKIADIYYSNQYWEQLFLNCVGIDGENNFSIAYIQKSNPSWPELKKKLEAKDEINVTLLVHWEEENGLVVDKVVRFTTSNY